MLCDAPVKHGVFADDNCRIVASINGSLVDYGKDSLGKEKYSD